jgi:AraC-like DNA-binding protein
VRCDRPPIAAGLQALNHMLDLQEISDMSRAISDTVVTSPASMLRPFIAQYAGFRVSGLPPGAHFGLPSSDVDLIISLGRPIDVLRMPNPTQRASTFIAFVSGLQDAPAIVRQDSDALGLHIFIKPFGVRAILGVPSVEITSLVLDFSDVWGTCAEELVEALVTADTWQQRFAVLDRAFISRLNPTSPRREIAWAWQRMEKSHGSVGIQFLADEIGWSRRHFSECFGAAIGVSPKLAARVFRFERACRLIAEKRPSLADVALTCGYYDQAHFTREWNALAGCSPKAWIARELPFLQDYELGGRDNECHDLKSVHQSFI